MVCRGSRKTQCMVHASESDISDSFPRGQAYQTRILDRILTDDLVYDDLRVWVHGLLLQIPCPLSPHNAALPQPELCNSVPPHGNRPCSLRFATTVQALRAPSPSRLAALPHPRL